MAYIGNSPGVASQRVVTEVTATNGQTEFTPTSGYNIGYIDVFMNGVKLINGTDFTADDGSVVTLTTGANTGDIIEMQAFIPRGLSDGYLKSETDALIAAIPEATPTQVSDQDNTSTGYFDLPSGTTAQRPSSPNTGYFRFNTTLDTVEYYNGSGWKSLDSAPVVSSISPVSATTANTEITITGQFFGSGAIVKFVGSDGTEYTSPSVVFNSSSELIAETPNTPLPAGNEPYDVHVTNPSGLVGILADALDAGGVPSWTTPSGSLTTGKTLYEGEIVQNTTLVATDPDGSAVTYAINSGSNARGLTVDTNTGALGGQPDAVTADTVRTFDVDAISNGDTTTQQFSVNVINDESAAYEGNLKLWLRAGWDGTTSGNKSGLTLPAAKWGSTYGDINRVNTIGSVVVANSTLNSSPATGSKYILDAQGGVSGLNTLAKQKDQYTYMCDSGDSFWVSIPSDNSVFQGSSGNHTICYWIAWENRSENYGGNHFSPTFHSWANNGGVAFVAHDWYTNGTSNVYMKHYANAAFQGDYFTPNISGGSNGNKGVWFHFAATYTNGAVAIYINGVAQSHSVGNTGTWPAIGSSQSCNFNGRGDGISGGLPGSYTTGGDRYKMQADLRYYNTPLSAGAIADIYNKTRSSFV